MTIQPFGKVGKAEIGVLETGLRSFFDEIKVATPMDIPQRAYDKKRGQYHVNRFMAALTPIRSFRVLGMVDLDLYSKELNFIFGQAVICGKDCIIAIERLKEGRKKEVFLERVLKEAVHELGHTFGLRHCPDIGCVMHFSNSLTDTDIKSSRFCKRCSEVLSWEVPGF